MSKKALNKELEDKDILKKALANERYVASVNNNRKLILYNIFLCIINKFCLCGFEKAFVVNGKAELKYADQKGFTTLYYAIISKDISKYRNLKTHISGIKFIRRFLIILKAFQLSDKELPLGYVIDFLLWKEYISKSNIKEIRNSGHYDRMTTQIALLAIQSKVKYSMRQHGLIGNNTHIPYKIPASRVLVFDENEKRKFEKNIILNNNCDYEINYQSSVKFSHTVKHRPRIGIIEVPIKEMQDIINMVCARFSMYQILIMIHPLSSSNKYDKHGAFFLEGEKEWNLDMIFSGPSTLVYDYLRQGFEQPIIVYDSPKGFNDIDKEYSNISICSTLDEFKIKIEEYRIY